MTASTRARRAAPSVEAPKRADDELTPRGARTKAALLSAARTIFERDGFLNARVTDIAEQAGVAHGTFYTYFHDKDDIFAAVVRTIDDDFHEPAPRPAGETLYEAILRANQRYYETYAGRGRMMGILEQVATLDDEMRSLRRDVRRRFVERSERAIRRWQDAGLADPAVDPHYAASALGSMVDRSVYLWLVLGEPHDKDVALETLSRLWVNALQLPPDHPARPAPQHL